jgi:hypothetical protein
MMIIAKQNNQTRNSSTYKKVVIFEEKIDWHEPEGVRARSVAGGETAERCGDELRSGTFG